MTAFQLCAGSSSPTILKRLASKGANIFAQNNAGQTAAMWAASFGRNENLRYLIDQGADINKKTKAGYSPLFFAIKSGNLSTLKEVVDLGADLQAVANDGTNVAQLAVYTKNYALLEWLIENSNVVFSREYVAQLLSAFDRNGYQLLHAMVQANQPTIVAMLLEKGADKDRLSEQSRLKWRYEANFKTEEYIPPQLTPLQIAEENKFSDIVQLLENSQANILSTR